MSTDCFMIELFFRFTVQKYYYSRIYTKKHVAKYGPYVSLQQIEPILQHFCQAENQLSFTRKMTEILFVTLGEVARIRETEFQCHLLNRHIRGT